MARRSGAPHNDALNSGSELSDQIAVTGPVEAGPWVSLATRSDFRVTRDVLNRVARAQLSGEPRKLDVLGIGKGGLVAPFQLDADGKVVAPLAPAPLRHARVPSPPLTRHELDQLPIAPDEEVAGYLKTVQPQVVRMRVRVETVQEQVQHAGATELPGRQADVVQDQQRNNGALGPRVVIGRIDLERPREAAFRVEGRRGCARRFAWVEVSSCGQWITESLDCRIGESPAARYLADSEGMSAADGGCPVSPAFRW